MPYDTLQDFLAALEAAGELRRIKTPVDPVLEVAEIADRVSKAADRQGYYPGAGKAPQPGLNQALLFEKVQGSSIPLAVNTFGSYKRMHMAVVGESVDEWADEVA